MHYCLGCNEGLDLMDVELTIVMPCLNEAETLESCIKKALYFIENSRIRGEIVVADNGSADGSQGIARRCGARVVDVPIRGYGAALYYGILAAHGKYCVIGDSDDSYDFSRLDFFIKELRTGADLVMGNRFLGTIAPGAMPWQNRYIGNPVLTWIGRFLFYCPVGDFHCGLRAFSKGAFLKMDLRTTGMEFASEMVIKATLMKMKIVEVPTTLSPDGRSRPPHLRPYRDGWRHLRFMLLFSPNWLFLYPGLALMAVGFVVGLILFVHPIYVGDVRLSIDTLIYCDNNRDRLPKRIVHAALSRLRDPGGSLPPSCLAVAVRQTVSPRVRRSARARALLDRWVICHARRERLVGHPFRQS